MKETQKKVKAQNQNEINKKIKESHKKGKDSKGNQKEMKESHKKR